MLALLSHTHCQVPPAGTQAKTWQRVFLFNRTADRKKKHMAVTKCIKHWANSANLKCGTLNKSSSGLKGKSFEKPNASFTNRYVQL